MKNHFIQFLLIFSISIFLHNEISGQSFRSLNFIESNYSAGYNFGPGNGGMFATDKLLEEVGKGYLGIGGLINFRVKNLRRGSETNLVAAGKITYLFQLEQTERWDLYAHAALGLGYEDISNDRIYMGMREELERTYTAWGVAAGARFHIVGGLGAFAELSYGIGYGSVGLTWSR